MNRQAIVLLRGIVAALVLNLCGGAATAQQSPGAQKAAKNEPSAVTSAALDRMIAAGKSQRELAQYLFDTHGCKECHTIGSEGNLGFTRRARKRRRDLRDAFPRLRR